MFRITLLVAATGACLCGATSASAQMAMGAYGQPNQNPMGLDYGPFHPAVPSQVTTYYPPTQQWTAPRRHRHVRGLAY